MCANHILNIIQQYKNKPEEENNKVLERKSNNVKIK